MYTEVLKLDFENEKHHLRGFKRLHSTKITISN